MDAIVNIGSRLELFVDRLIVDALKGTSFKMHTPCPAPLAKARPQGAYMTILRDGERYRAYYREYDPTYTGDKHDGNIGEMTCLAESADGVEWTFPSLGLCEVNGNRDNNAVLAHKEFYCHNFAPFIDTRPGVPAEERYKALAGTRHGHGLSAFVSADGIHWNMKQEGVIRFNRELHGNLAFDSQNVSFWSEAEGCYVCYFRTWLTPHGKLRTISRATSSDYLNWTDAVAMNPNLPGEHLYTSQTHPYFRAPHIYIALPTRYQPDRGSSTDILFMASRAGSQRFERLFTEAFIRPGPDPDRWGNRSNYAACGVIPAGPTEMSVYHAKTGQRHVLRTDGFISVNVGPHGGELITKPLTFTGRELVLNAATSAAGSITIEIQDLNGNPLPGFALVQSVPLINDGIALKASWQEGADLGALSGRPVRLRFVMNEADLYSLRFQ